MEKDKKITKSESNSSVSRSSTKEKELSQVTRNVNSWRFPTASSSSASSTQNRQREEESYDLPMVTWEDDQYQTIGNALKKQKKKTKEKELEELRMQKMLFVPPIDRQKEEEMNQFTAKLKADNQKEKERKQKKKEDKKKLSKQSNQPSIKNFFTKEFSTIKGLIPGSKRTRDGEEILHVTTEKSEDEQTLSAMGFDDEQVKEALNCNPNVDSAIQWLLRPQDMDMEIFDEPPLEFRMQEDDEDKKTPANSQELKTGPKKFHHQRMQTVRDECNRQIEVITARFQRLLRENLKTKENKDAGIQTFQDNEMDVNVQVGGNEQQFEQRDVEIQTSQGIGQVQHEQRDVEVQTSQGFGELQEEENLGNAHVVIVDDYIPNTQEPPDGIYRINIIENFHPMLKESKGQFRDFGDDSNQDVGKKAIALLLGRDESEYINITSEDYDDACNLRKSQFRQVYPTGAPPGLSYYSQDVGGTDRRRCVFSFYPDKRNGKAYRSNRVCSLCFGCSGGPNRSEVYNNRVLCPKCGELERYFYSCNKFVTHSEEKIVIFTRKFKLSSPVRLEEEKRKKEILTPDGLTNFGIPANERSKYSLLRGFCWDSAEEVSYKSACEKICFMFKALFEKGNKKITFHNSRVEVPKGDLAFLVSLLNKMSIKITGMKTDEPGPSLPAFARPFRDKDKKFVIYSKSNPKVWYPGQRSSKKGKKEKRSFEGCPDQVYEAETKTKLNENKHWTCQDEAAMDRMEAIFITASTIAYFLRGKSPLTNTPINMLGMTIPYGDLESEDGKLVLDLLHSFFKLKVKVSF